MDLKELKAQHPALVAELEAEFDARSQQANAAAKESAKTEIMSLVRALGSEELAGKIEAVLASGVSSSQLAALAPIFAAQAKPAEKTAEEKILAGLEKAGAPLPTGNIANARVNPLLADAMRRQKEARL